MSRSIGSSLRAATFVLAGAALASVLMGPVAGQGSGRSTPAATMHTRAASCAGVSFIPDDDRDGIGSVGTMRYRRSSAAGDGFYLCDPGLPHGAKVTKVQFIVKDGHSTADITFCALVRSGLNTGTATYYSLLAGSLSTSGAPGVVKLTDSSIVDATVDNRAFGYWLQCKIGTSDLGIGIFGATVTYRISSANG